MKNRLFIALKLPEEIRREIISFRDEVNEEEIPRKWEPIEKLHITLKFLGDVEDIQNKKIETIIESIITEYPRIICEYDRFGFFLPRILWLGLRVEKHLFDIVNRLNFDLEKLNFEREMRNFKPHITILRIKDKLSPDFVTKFNSFKLPAKKFTLDEIALMESKLQKSGSIYTELKNYKLK